MLPNFPLSELNEVDDAPLAVWLLRSDAQTEILGPGRRGLLLPKVGDRHPGHRHNRDHRTYVVSGSLTCSVDGAAPKQYKAGESFETKADHWHELTATADNTLFHCVFPVRDGDNNNDYDEAPVSPEEVRARIKRLKTSPCSTCAARC